MGLDPESGGVVVVRPDGYVGIVTSLVEGAGTVDALNAKLICVKEQSLNKDDELSRRMKELLGEDNKAVDSKDGMNMFSPSERMLQKRMKRAEERKARELEAAVLAAKQRRLMRRWPQKALVAPLEPEWERKVEQVLSRRGEVIATTMKGIEIYQDSFERLIRAQQWLNDETINTYLEWVVKAGNQAAADDMRITGEAPSMIPKFIAHNSFFYTILLKEGPARSERIMKRLKVPGISLLEVDTVYSGGRDGAICAWDLNLDLKSSATPDAENPFESPEDPPEDETKRSHASSDLTVRVWRPLSNDSEAPQTIGQHADYVKCLATPNSQADWVASGGLDRKICLWDLNGAGKKLEIEVGDEEKSEKGSVYALSASRSILASGGPESIVRLWDPRSGKRVTNVWSLYSEDPSLGIFYSSDRAGLVVKTDVRGTLGELDDGLSLAVAQENDGVGKVIAHGDYIWTATSSSSINRWANVDTGSDIQLPEAYRRHRASSVASRPRQLSTTTTTNGASKKEIPAQSILRISNTASFPSAMSRETDSATAISAFGAARKGSEAIVDPDIGKSPYPRHGWGCIAMGLVRAVVLEEYNCFDAEMYADELTLEEPVDFRDDQRINLGKWVLRHIFSNLIDELIKRDEFYRKKLNDNLKKPIHRPGAPSSIQIPTNTTGWQDTTPNATPRGNGQSYPMTPGMGIGVATPAVSSHLPGVPEDGAPLDKRASQASRSSADYFSSTPIATDPKTVATPGEKSEDNQPKSPSDADKETNGKDVNTLFGKKFRMGMSFGSKKLGRSASTNTEKPVVVDEKTEDGSESSENGEKEKEVDDSFFGVVQKIRNDYEKALIDNPEQPVETGITPSLPNETPVLKPPPLTTVIIQEETSGGSADLYRGTVATVGEDASIIEQRAPMWLGDLLLRVSKTQCNEERESDITQNRIPIKEPVKVSFILQPWQDQLPSIAGPDGNSRLNANRMLRVKKILAYVAERIEPAPEVPDPNALSPEEYLELYCYDQVSLLASNMNTTSNTS
ncbi:putative Uncharacterized WD repeat-containing protein C31A2.14 [Glarea lozoyensis 74030]|uniref:Putative Uncharacterized WD repeat-containing protein C31A2.14 n=1 Tax=Glarea lozoyensis (strain ATCC 74030 / MF5533) TaxID=1104152 RepID=H0EV02_GLAL7|nr:putative Uncharacterized WD repeat-containing protein C31A2.14 [Glarea lozoyensis 74030]